MTTPEIAELGEPTVSGKLSALLILGFAATLLGLILIALAAVFSRNGSSGFSIVIFLGPIPIVFGAGPAAQWLILMAGALTTLSLLMLLVLRRKPSGPRV
jgi:uncharacterized membrane protein